MRFNVVVPIYNEERSLPGTLLRLRDLQARDDCSIILVDGQSDDRSRALLRQSGLAWVDAPRGRAAQMNSGAAATDGDVLIFLHADTILPTGALDAIREALEAGAVGGFFRLRLDAAGGLLHAIGLMITLRSRLTGVATGDQALFVARPAFERLGGYAPVPLFEDIDFSRRLRRCGPIAKLRLCVITSARRWRRLGTARTVVRMWLLRAGYALGMSPDRLARYYEVAR